MINKRNKTHRNFFKYLLMIYLKYPYGIIFALGLSFMVTAVGTSGTKIINLSEQYNFWLTLPIAAMMPTFTLCFLFIPLTLGIARHTKVYKLYSTFEISKWKYWFYHFIINFIATFIIINIVLLVSGLLFPLSFRFVTLINAQAYFAFLFIGLFTFIFGFSLALLIASLGKHLALFSVISTFIFLIYFVVGFLTPVVFQVGQIAIIQYVFPFLGFERLGFLALIGSMPYTFYPVEQFVPFNDLLNVDWKYDWLAFITPLMYASVFYTADLFVPYWNLYVPKEAKTNLSPLIQINQLSVHFKNKDVLDRVSLDINEGDRIGIIGKNGSGKTTLIETMIGANALKKRGSITYYDKENHNLKAVFQEYNFDNHFNLKKTFKYFSQIALLDYRDDEIDALFEKYEIYHVRKSKYNKLSGGEKQKFKLMMAIELQPNILVLDELTTSLDYEWRQEIIDLILKNINDDANKKALVIVSHDYYELKNLCNKFYLLANGKLKPVELDDYFKKYQAQRNIIS